MLKLSLSIFMSVWGEGARGKLRILAFPVLAVFSYLIEQAPDGEAISWYRAPGTNWTLFAMAFAFSAAALAPILGAEFDRDLRNAADKDLPFLEKGETLKCIFTARLLAVLAIWTLLATLCLGVAALDGDVRLRMRDGAIDFGGPSVTEFTSAFPNATIEACDCGSHEQALRIPHGNFLFMAAALAKVFGLGLTLFMVNCLLDRCFGIGSPAKLLVAVPIFLSFLFPWNNSPVERIFRIPLVHPDWTWVVLAGASPVVFWLAWIAYRTRFEKATQSETTPIFPELKTGEPQSGA